MLLNHAGFAAAHSDPAYIYNCDCWPVRLLTDAGAPILSKLQNEHTYNGEGVAPDHPHGGIPLLCQDQVLPQ